MINRNPAELVTLEVGPEKKKFIVHKEFACHYFPVLKAAFNSEFIEGQTQTYVLEEVTEPVARLLVDWLYTQKLDICRYENDHPKRVEEGLSLCRLWVLAGKSNFALLFRDREAKADRTIITLSSRQVASPRTPEPHCPHN